VRRIKSGTPRRQPVSAYLEASYPLPSRRNLCPGRTESADSSGAPRNTEGIKSRKVWAIDMLVMNTIIARGEKWRRREAREEITIAATRLMWIPGRRPVMTPIPIPSKIATIISIIIVD